MIIIIIIINVVNKNCLSVVILLCLIVYDFGIRLEFASD